MFAYVVGSLSVIREYIREGGATCGRDCPMLIASYCNATHVQNVTARMSREELDLLDRLANERGESRSDAIRAAIRRGAREELIRIALQRYREGEVGMRGAAEIAGLTIAEMMHEANERGVLSNYDEADLEDDVDALR